MRRYKRFPVPMLLAVLAGCVHLPPSADRAQVSQRIEQRMGHSLGSCAIPDKIALPENLDIFQKLSEDQAVLIALWNNPLFQEMLVDLKLTKADLVQANMLPNPEVLYYFSAPDKPFRYLADFPIEALWLRPIRLKAAEQENARAAERLTQVALDLIRDTRQAYADLLLAKERVRVAADASKLRGRIAELAETRLKNGDASVQEASTAKIDALVAAQDAVRIGFEVPLAEERIRNLLGLSGITGSVVPESVPLGEMPELNADELAADATVTRPDAVAASHFVAAAAERLRLSKLSWFRFLGIADATTGTKTDHEFGPGFRVTLPIFNWGQGGKARAQAELEQAQRRYLTVQNQIQLDVRQAHLRYGQARAELALLREKVRPEVESAIRRAEKTYKDGGAPYLIVLESSRQLIDTYNREAQLHADLRRAWADLERSVGRRLSDSGTKN